MEKRELKRIQYFAASLLCLAIFSVGARGNLAFFIHPRYSLFTVLMSLISFGVLLLAVFFYEYRGKPTKVVFSSYIGLICDFLKMALSKGVWIILLVLLALVILEPKPLLSSSANNKRSQNYWQDYENIKFASWSKNPTQINEVVGLLLSPDTSELISGKNIKLSGFVKEINGSREFTLARFVVNCCAVDANPTQIKVALNEDTKLNKDSWVEVEGVAILKLTATISEPSLGEARIRQIGEPEMPYEYLRFE